VLERTDRVWVSDCIDPLDRQLMHRWTTQLIPPELMGAHIASGRSHTTGRVHDLDFRAATAIFGHLGIEWDLTQATPDERAELREWIALFKEHRGLLLGGDLVRLDHPDETVLAGGVVAPDQSSALYSFASVGRSDVVSPGRLRLPGLDPDRRYRVTPLMLDFSPSGLRPPPWWGVREGTADDRHGHDVRFVADRDPLGVELTGSALSAAGLQAAQFHPDHVVLYLAQAL
jgi:alpha-galactosidase